MSWYLTNHLGQLSLAILPGLQAMTISGSASHVYWLTHKPSREQPFTAVKRNNITG